MRLRARRSRPCPQCGRSAPTDARWCGDCGAALRPGDRAATDGEVPDTTGDDVDAPARAGGRVLAGVLLVALLGGLLLGQAAQEPAVVAAGFTSRGDGARTGIVSATTPPAPTGVAWRAEVEQSPALHDGTGVVGVTTAAGRELVVVVDPTAGDRRLTVHDAADGSVWWTTALPQDPPPYRIAVADGLVVDQTQTSVQLLDLAARDVRWRVERRLLGDAVLTHAGVVGVPTGAEGLAVVLLGLEDGSERWRWDGPAGRVTRLLAAGEQVVVLGDDRDRPLLVSLDLTGGGQLQVLDASLPRDLDRFPRARVVADDRLLAVPRQDDVLLVDVRTGEVEPLRTVGGFAPAVAAFDDGLLLLASTDGLLTAHSVTDGSTDDTQQDTPPRAAPRWERTLPEPPLFGLEVVGDRVHARLEGRVAVLDSSSGALVGEVALPVPTGGAAATTVGDVVQLDPDGTLVAHTAGDPRWAGPSVVVHPPDLVTRDGAVAVSTPTGVAVHDVADGARRWAAAQFDEELVTAGSLFAPALLAGRVATSPPEGQPPARGGLLGLSVETGILDWIRDSDRVPPRGEPIVDRDLLLVPVGSQLLGFDAARGVRRLVVETNIPRTDVAAADDWLVALDARTDAGDVWVGRRSTRRMVYRAPIRACAPPVVHEDLVLVTDHLGDVLARELATGDQPWGERTGGVACRPLSVLGDTLVALVDDRVLLGIGLDDGEAGWRVELPAHAAGAPTVAGDHLLVPTLDGAVSAWTVGADDPVWRLDLGAVPVGSVAVDGDTLLVRTRDGDLLGMR